MRKVERGHTGRTRGMSHREIASALGMSHARVQRIERGAILKLRKEAKRLRIDWSLLV